MLQAEAELFAKPQARNDAAALSSDESETDQEDETKHFQEVIDDYADPEPAGGFQKKVLAKLDTYISSRDSLDLLEWSKLYINIENEYFGRLNTSKSNRFAIIKARYIYCICSQLALRIGNSSSVLERSFGDAVRSIANRRVQLRNDINSIFKIQVFQCVLYFIFIFCKALNQWQKKRFSDRCRNKFH